MKKGIEDLAYLIKKAKRNGEPKPIVILGAGVSKSGGIPLANGIVKYILKEYKGKPSIERLNKDQKQDYYELMTALNAKERRQVFKYHINKSQVNVGHIYLAQLIEEEYIDYVLTVNFDDLLIRACGLFNYSIPTYDISNVKDFTTTTFQEQSVVYLHGQHYGEWLLNARGELDKVKGHIPNLLNKLCHNRTWIVVGYSGQDEIFKELNSFSSFDNDLYWVGYLDSEPNENVAKKMLQVETKNAHLISGYDADTFFLDLHAKLGLQTPQIFDKPFSFLKTMVKEVQLPEEESHIEDHKELYTSLSERMEISKDWIDRAIIDIEEDDSIGKFKQQIIEAYIKEEFEKNEKIFIKKIKQKRFKAAQPELAVFYFYWGLSIQKSVRGKEDISLINTIIEKYKESIKYNSEEASVYNNYGNALSALAKATKDCTLYEKSFEQYEKAINIRSNDYSVYYNYANGLYDLARNKSDLSLYKKSIDKYLESIKLNPKFSPTYNNYGSALSHLAELKSDTKLYEESFKQFKKAIQLDKRSISAYTNYATALISAGKLTSNKALIERAITISNEGYILDGNPYNIACANALLGHKLKALVYLEETLEKNLIEKVFILGDDDWKDYLEDKDFKKLLAKY